jgi:uncharacterized OsmC-like protein
MSTFVKNRVNGLDMDQLARVVGEVQGDPAAGLAGFRVATEWKGATRTESVVTQWSLGGRSLPRDFAIPSDEPEEILGGASAPNPQELLMAGLNACLMVGYVAQASVLGVRIERLFIECEGTLDLRGFLGLDPDVSPGYEEIRFTVRIRCDGSREQIEQIHRNAQATSPNAWNLGRPVRLVPTLVVE